MEDEKITKEEKILSDELIAQDLDSEPSLDELPV